MKHTGPRVLTLTIRERVKIPDESCFCLDYVGQQGCPMLGIAHRRLSLSGRLQASFTPVVGDIIRGEPSSNPTQGALIPAFVETLRNRDDVAFPEVQLQARSRINKNQ